MPGSASCGDSHMAAAISTTFRKTGVNAGAANLPSDSTGVIRRYSPQSGRLPSIAAVVARRLTGRSLALSAFAAVMGIVWLMLARPEIRL